MPTLAAPLDCAKLEIRNERVHQLSTAPSSPVTGQMYYNTTDNTLYWWNNAAWVAAAGGSPSGAAGGDLAGSTYPNPQIAAGAIVLADCNSTLIDQAAGTASLRTLGLTATKAMPGNTALDSITPPVGSLNLNGQKITSLGTPTLGGDATTKTYVDGVAQGLDVKLSCRLATTANVVLSGPGANTDTVAMVVGDRILLKNQTAPAENGIWIFNGAAVAMTRATDADTAGVSGEVTTGMFTFIEEGTNNASSGWVLTTAGPITLGTTGLTFVQFSGAGQITAGTGMIKTGNTLDVQGTAARITANADTIDIAATYVGQSSITTLGTITTGTWNGAAIGVGNGGTGSNTAPSARFALGAAGVYTSATHGAGTGITITQATHGLTATRGLLVQCQIEATGAVILPDITVAASGQVDITFSVSQSANTIRTTIIG